MKIIDCEQNSEAWFAARLGKPTVSMLSTICTSKGEASKGVTREKLISTYVAEILSGDRQESYSSSAMERGAILEAEAAEMFAFQMGLQVNQVGFILHDSEEFGASPDRIIEGTEIGLEIKCPLPHTHIDYLIDNKLPTAYIQQVQGSMLVTGFQQWYFMSYCQNLKPMILLIQKDEELCAKMHRQLLVFIKEIKDKIEIIEAL